MKKIILLGMLFSVGIVNAGKKEIVKAVSPYIESGEIAGLVSMTSVSGKVETVYLGLADPKTGRKFNEKSFFWIASMSKGFTGAAIMSLVDQGKVSLDDPIKKYIPSIGSIQVKEKRKDGTAILRPPKVDMTIRMCLSHMAGFPFKIRAMDSWGIDSMPLKVLAENLSEIPLPHDPMTGHRYSNLDIDLCSRVVEVVSGMPFETYLQKTFFDPLGMREITFFPTKEQFANRVFLASVKKGCHYKEGSIYMLDPSKTNRHGRFAEGGGGLYSTAGDVMKFYQMLANDGKAPDGTRILSHDAILELSRAQYPKYNRYSLGLRQYGDWFGHDGALQTEALANWKENRVVLMFVQITGTWNHPYKNAWHRAVGVPAH